MSVVVETMTIGGTEYTKTYSDAGRYVVREDFSYVVAVDPAEYGRTYTEGDLIEEESDAGEATAEEIMEILLGGIEE